MQKAALILRAYSATQPEWGVRALAAHLGIPRATAHAYLSGLAEAGFLRRTSAGKYRLSWHLAEMGAQLTGALPWFQEARALMTRLALETQSVAFLCILEGNEVVAAIRERHPDAGLELPVDIYLPTTATASGKVLYAFHELEPQHFTECTPNSITTPDEWSTEVARVKELGYARSIEEWMIGQCTLAVPYYSAGQVVAAVGVQLSSERYLAHEKAIHKKVLSVITQ